MSVLKITAIGGVLLLAVSALAIANRPAGDTAATAQHSAKTQMEMDDRSVQTDQQPSNHKAAKSEQKGKDEMQLGNFSVSLAVKDLKVSKAFYEKLDFQHIFGKVEQNFVIMQNGTTTIGLFQGMFEDNLLTFNPGWNHKSETLDDFKDVRELQATFIDRGITPVKETDPTSTGPASFVIVDPDGNTILFDQHVPKPE